MTSKQVNRQGFIGPRDKYIRPNLHWIGVPKHDSTYDFKVAVVNGKDTYFKKDQKPPPPRFPDVKAIGIPDYWRHTNLVWPSA